MSQEPRYNAATIRGIIREMKKRHGSFRRLSAVLLSSGIDVSDRTLQSWEEGATFPPTDKADALYRLARRVLETP